MKRPLILIGGGGHCKSVIEVAESTGYEIKGILDMPDEVGKEVLPGHKVIGTDDEMRVCHKSVTHPFLFFAFSQIRNL